MKTTYNWIREYVELEATPEEVADRLTMLGLEVESLERVQAQFQGVVVAQILSVEPVPGSDHLWLAVVDAGSRYGKMTVVCGARNVRAKLWAALALPGAILADGQRVEPRSFGSVTSQGMLCSEAELGLTSRAEGILLLDNGGSLWTGQDLRDVVGEDWVFEVNVTPNRPDCLGTIGIARELSAAWGKELRLPRPRLSEEPERVEEWVRVDVQAPEACPRYTARFLWDVQVAPSPLWLARRLELVGMRSINNVVDVTNYVMLEFGQPLHAFDYDRLDEGTIVVKFAREGEEFITLDGKLRTLFSDTLLICDRSKPVAIAGVMGGENSEVSERTRRVLLESAYFSPDSIRRTKRKLTISTDSSYRFERGVDPEGVVAASNRACELILRTAGGKLARGIVDVYPDPIRPRTVFFRPSRANQVLGTAIPSREMEGILRRLGLEVQEQETGYAVTVPTFRPDLTREIDLIEEVARHYGYERIHPDPVAPIDESRTGEGRDQLLEKARSLLVGLGFFETVNLSLISRAQAEAFSDGPETLVKVLNPLGEELAWLRPSLLPGLLASTVRNLNRRQPRVFLFEWGKVFARSADGAYCEKMHLAGTICGIFAYKTWRTQERAADFYDLKGVVEEVLRDLTGRKDIRLEASDRPWLEEGGFALCVDETKVGYAGQLARDVLKSYDCEQAVYGFEVDWERVKAVAITERIYVPIPKFPPVQQDLALLADETLPAGAVEAVIWKHGGPYLQSVRLFDLYRGPQIPAGKKSLAFALTFQAEERTLTEQEVRDRIEEILRALAQELGVTLRPR
jgi:phenylalanyl-tRNA synthetase beta chain